MASRVVPATLLKTMTAPGPDAVGKAGFTRIGLADDGHLDHVVVILRLVLGK